MKQKTEKETNTRDYVSRRLIDKSSKNWKRISFNDFGVIYPQDFIDAKKEEKELWKNLLLQKSMIGLKEE